MQTAGHVSCETTVGRVVLTGGTSESESAKPRPGRESLPHVSLTVSLAEAGTARMCAGCRAVHVSSMLVQWRSCWRLRAPAAAGPAGSVTGTVTLAGAPPVRPELPVQKNREVCGEMVADDRLVIGPSGGVRYAVVTVEGSKAARSPSPMRQSCSTTARVTSCRTCKRPRSASGSSSTTATPSSTTPTQESARRPSSTPRSRTIAITEPGRRIAQGPQSHDVPTRSGANGERYTLGTGGQPRQAARPAVRDGTYARLDLWCR